MFGAGRKILKNKIFPVLLLKNLGKILELEIWEKLSHKNAIKMAWWVIFNFMPIRKVSNCGAFDQNCGVFEEKNWGRFLAQKRALPDSKPVLPNVGIYPQCGDFETHVGINFWRFI